ncbi:bystin [Conger conger]|uniref:bystin n=1 Tax=Conger conger TaxID=82655 RepID=UPI002A5A2A07|nr:bystin [Conger conger]
MPKVKKSKGGGGEKSGVTVGLADQILQGDVVRVSGRMKSRDRRQEDEDEYVDERLSRKILEQARIQQEELQTEYGLGKPEIKKQPSTVLGSGTQDLDSDEEWPALGQAGGEDDGECGTEVEVDPDDEKAMQMFMNKNPPLRRTLADIIMEKITEKQTEVGTVMSEVSGRPLPQLDPESLRCTKA